VRRRESEVPFADDDRSLAFEPNVPLGDVHAVAAAILRSPRSSGGVAQRDGLSAA
jgi:hypothetical protein